MDEIETRVDRAIQLALSATVPEQKSIDPHVLLSSAAGLDSVQVMNLVMEIEDSLDISVPVDVLADVHTLHELSQKLVELIRSASHHS